MSYLNIMRVVIICYAVPRASRRMGSGGIVFHLSVCLWVRTNVLAYGRAGGGIFDRFTVKFS